MHVLAETCHEAVALAQVVVFQVQVEVLKGQGQGVIALHVGLTVQEVLNGAGCVDGFVSLLFSTFYSLL